MTTEWTDQHVVNAYRKGFTQSKQLAILILRGRNMHDAADTLKSEMRDHDPIQDGAAEASQDSKGQASEVEGNPNVLKA